MYFYRRNPIRIAKIIHEEYLDIVVPYLFVGKRDTDFHVFHPKAVRTYNVGAIPNTLHYLFSEHTTNIEEISRDNKRVGRSRANRASYWVYRAYMPIPQMLTLFEAIDIPDELKRLMLGDVFDHETKQQVDLIEQGRSSASVPTG